MKNKLLINTFFIAEMGLFAKNKTITNGTRSVGKIQTNNAKMGRKRSFEES